MKRKFLAAKAAFLLGASVFTGAARAEGSTDAKVTLTEHNIENSVRVYALVNYVTIKNSSSDTTASSASISGPALTIGFIYGITPKWGLSAIAEQAFTFDFSSLYSELAVGLNYAFLGSLKNIRHQFLANDTVVYDSVQSAQGVLRGTLLANQYFLNGSNRVVGLSGVGLALYYDYNIDDKWSYTGGLMTGMSSNGTLKIMPIEFSFGLTLML